MLSHLGFLDTEDVGIGLLEPLWEILSSDTHRFHLGYIVINFYQCFISILISSSMEDLGGYKEPEKELSPAVYAGISVLVLFSLLGAVFCLIYKCRRKCLRRSDLKKEIDAKAKTEINLSTVHHDDTTLAFEDETKQKNDNETKKDMEMETENKIKELEKELQQATDRMDQLEQYCAERLDAIQKTLLNKLEGFKDPNATLVLDDKRELEQLFKGKIDAAHKSLLKKIEGVKSDDRKRDKVVKDIGSRLRLMESSKFSTEAETQKFTEEIIKVQRELEMVKDVVTIKHCTICNKKMRTTDGLMHHMQTVHN